jgi:hypothetical protein
LAKGLAYGLAEVEDISIRLLGPTGRGASGRSAGQQGFGLVWEECGRNEVRGIERGIGYFLFRHSHGGTGCGSALLRFALTTISGYFPPTS